MTQLVDPTDGSLSRAALEGLGLALFVYETSGHFRLAGTPPEWLERLWPSVTAAHEVDLAQLSPFLDNFLADARTCWSSRTPPTRSGPWVEYDQKGTELHLQATAVTDGRSALLLLERLGEEFEATRSVLQRARETLLAYQQIAQPHPPEIGISLDRLRAIYPDYRQCGFLIMRFLPSRPYSRIVNCITETARSRGLHVLRADSHELHGDLLSNVRTYLHGCSFGIAVYERIESDAPNANVGLEIGYLMALNKPVLLLKDRTIPHLQADLAGRLYRTFDAHDPEGTIPGQLNTWLEDQGIALPGSGNGM